MVLSLFKLLYVKGVTSYSVKPLYLGLIFGLIGIFMSVALIIYSLYNKINNLDVPGTTGILITISFFSGSILFTLGILGIYIGRIFEQSKRRDQYIIKDIKSKKEISPK